LVTAVVALAALQRTTWWASYDFRNCEHCQPRIDWASLVRAEVSSQERLEFNEDGVTVLKGALLDTSLVEALGRECDELPNTFMTSVLANFVLRFYLRYEHRLETRSELLRDWAVHGPFGKWAAQLLGVKEVRLYNSELIFHRGEESPTCEPAWHRDSLAAPFGTEVPTAVFNIYLHDSDATKDGLIYVKGSHRDPSSMPDNIEIIEPRIEVGDVLVHVANSYHTTSGRGCWNRRSLQFRYFAADTDAVFSHGPSHLAGPFPWTFAHASGVAPHGLHIGDALKGAWYPLVHPTPLASEQISVPDAQAWGILKLGSVMSASAALINNTATGLPTPGVLVMDGLVKDANDWQWEVLNGFPMAKMKKAARVN